MDVKDLTTEALHLADQEFRKYPTLNSVIFRNYGPWPGENIEVTQEALYAEMARRDCGFVN